MQYRQTEHTKEAPPKFDLLTADELERRVHSEWLVDGMIPLRGMTIVYGPPAACKSFFVAELGLSIGSDRDTCLGRSIMNQPVVYVVAEGAGAFGRRVSTWRRARSYPNTSKIRFITEPVQLHRTVHMDSLIKAAGSLGGAPLVIVDTLARCFSLDENSARDVGLLISQIGRLQRELGATVILVHHSGKYGGKERGSSALRGAADAVIAVSREGDRVTVRSEKSKDFEEFGDVHLRLARYRESCVLELSDESGPAEDGILKTDNAVQMLEALAAHTHLRASAWKDVADIDHDSTFYRIKKRLLKEGLVQESIDGFSATEAGIEALRGFTPPVSRPLPNEVGGVE